MNMLILTKPELLQMIEAEIEKEKEFIQECIEMKVNNTTATEWKLSNLMFMYNYISNIEDVTDIEEDKQESLDHMNFR